jgi:hypothetical protein
MNLLKPKEVFVGNIPLHKNLSQVFTQQSHFKRFKFIFEAYFSEKATRNTLFFLPVLVFIFKRGCRTSGDEFVETKRGFCWEHSPSQKTLSGFTQKSHFKRFKFIFEAYFSDISQ